MIILPLLASTYLFTCTQVDQLVANMWDNTFLTEEDKVGLLRAALESAPPGCSAHNLLPEDEQNIY